MMILVTYDISLADDKGQQRLRRIAKVCLDHGIRVQYSTFECEVDPAQWVQFKAKLLNIYDETVDSLRFYRLGSNWQSKVEHHGAKPAPDIFRDALIV
jgi:CRISPR-associated protein Cas2